MALRADQQKQDRIEAVALLAAQQERAGEAAAGFARLLYAHVPPADVMAREVPDLASAALSLWGFAGKRAPGQPRIRAFNPDPKVDGWLSSRTVVQIVNDDMPFLVDSLTIALNSLDLVVDLVVHPVMRVRRDDDGTLVGLATGDESEDDLRESLMHVEVTHQSDPARLEEIAQKLHLVFTDVRNAVEDWQAMRTTLAAALMEIGTRRPPLPPKDIAEAVDFLKWLDEDNFTFLGYREYRYDIAAGKGDGFNIIAGPGLGILRDPSYSVFDGLRNFGALPAEIQVFLRRRRLLMVTKSNRRATVHRAAHMDAIGVKLFDEKGDVVGERLFVGLFTSLAYSRSARAIPLLRQKVAQVMARSGFAPSSHDGKSLQHILDTYPRDELFQVSEDELLETALGILNLQERQRIALFVRRDPFERFVSALVYVPRDRYNTDLRQRMAAIIAGAYAGTIAGFQTQVDDSVLARVHYIVRTTRGQVPPIETAEVERRLAEAGRTWADHLAETLLAAHPESTAEALLKRYRDAFPTAYRERVAVADSLADIERIDTTLASGTIGMALYRPSGQPGGQPAGADASVLGFKIYAAGRPVALSDILPMLENMGLRVIGEVPHAVAVGGVPGAAWVQDFELTVPTGEAVDIAQSGPRFEKAFARVWSGKMENDGFNRLVLLARLAWRQVVVLRAYAKILRQAGTTFSQAYMEATLARHPAIARLLVTLFELRFDPAGGADANLRANGIVQEIDHALDAVTNLDEDRILRSFLVLIQKSLRTNFFQRTAEGGPKSYLSIKLSSHEIDLLPLPRPLYEIFVYSPRVEGVHLRGGKVARGGIRWSDRREDFRTEILGLMKAQMVKNSVIVPVGSKGGFVVKRPPPASAGREAALAEGIECYKILMRGLLDITDNIVGDALVPPRDVVRRDDDDPYLVVAADKGTATFSDIANGVSLDYGFWLGDAFASGGSAGYDHKGMGITARGAWETVKRHFREIGTDIQAADFTVVGVGDMSGDVFGNGMLLSKHIRLLGAFNHLHIFLDPDPDPAKSLAERQRLFALPRSAWSDYDASLISKGGGIFERSAKSIALSAEVKARFGIPADRLTPADLIQVLLKAEVDLLWFGGIGTYVKAVSESHAEVGDRANDALRINGRDIRARVVGEGANLGCTQRGRVEYALKGGRLNTDAIDNSAGVDTSDHEVNLKILLNGQVASGDITVAQRDETLRALTLDVGQHVLRDNYLQGLALTLAEAQGIDVLDQQTRLMRTLERAGKLDRAIEFLPDDDTLASRAMGRVGLTRPELAVLLAYAKNVLYAELLPSDLADDPLIANELFRYFPKALVKRLRGLIAQHRLRREIIATGVTNSMVNRAGITFVNEMKERSGRPASDVARAYAITRDVFELRPLWTAIEELDNKVPAAVQTDMMLASMRLIERATAWFLRRGLPLDIAARVEQFRPRVADLARGLGTILPEAEAAAFAQRQAQLVAQGVPEPIAARAARLDFLLSAGDVVGLSDGSSLDITEIGRVYFAVGNRFCLGRLRAAARRLPADTAWQKLAVTALVDDFFGLQSDIAARAIAGGASDATAALAGFEAGHKPLLGALDPALQEITAAPMADMAMLTVAARQLRALAGG